MMAPLPEHRSTAIRSSPGRSASSRMPASVTSSVQHWDSNARSGLDLDAPEAGRADEVLERHLTGACEQLLDQVLN